MAETTTIKTKTVAVNNEIVAQAVADANDSDPLPDAVVAVVINNDDDDPEALADLNEKEGSFQSQFRCVSRKTFSLFSSTLVYHLVFPVGLIVVISIVKYAIEEQLVASGLRGVLGGS